MHCLHCKAPKQFLAPHCKTATGKRAKTCTWWRCELCSAIMNTSVWFRLSASTPAPPSNP